jgi:Bacterial Ig domain/Bacterial Ig-like domain/Glucodextranase, domain B
MLKNKGQKLFIKLLISVLMLSMFPPITITSAESTEDYLYITSDTTFTTTETVDKTIVIAPNVRLMIETSGDYTVNGDFIIYGELTNKGKLNVNGDIYANHYNGWMYGDSSNPAGKLTNYGEIKSEGLNVTTKYPTPPLTITSPEKDATVQNENLYVYAETFPGIDYAINGPLNGGGGFVGMDGTFNERVVLQEGPNDIEVIATDPFGNSSTQNIAVTYSKDEVPPVVTETDPLDGSSNISIDRAEIIITYNEPIQQGPLFHDIFIDDEKGQLMTTARVEGNTLKLSSGSPLKNGTTYTVRIFPNSISDITGNGTSELYMFSFTTEEDKAAPGAPVVKEVTDQSVSVSGKAEEDSTIIVKVDDTEIGTGITDLEGNFSVSIPKQQAGKVLVVTATDKAGNESGPSRVTVLDKTPPEIPVVNEVTDQATSVTGMAEVGSLIQVKAGGQKIGSSETESDGKFNVTIPKQQAGKHLEVTATDGAGNESVSAHVTVKDLTAPAVPRVNEVTDQSTKVTGTAESIALIRVKVKGEKIGEGIAESEGSFSVTIPKQKAGTVVELTAIDGAGNVSGVTKTSVIDVTPPPAPVVDEVTDQSTKVTGKAEAESTVKVIVGLEEIAVTEADLAGDFTVSIPKQQADQLLEIIAIDQTGNKSESTVVKVKDDTPPTAPEVNEVTDQTTIVKGKAEEGTTVTIRSGDEIIATGKAGYWGSFEILIPLQAINTVLTITAEDAAGLRSPETEVVVKDGAVLPDPEVDPLTDESDRVTGDCYCDQVMVKSGGKLIGGNTTDADGRFIILISPQAAGTDLIVYAIDTATGNTSYQKVQVKLTPPVVKEINDKSEQVTGTAKAGNVLRIYVNGSEVSKGTAGSNGDFSIPITPIKAGTEVKVTAEDVSGNISEAVKLIVADVTAPLAPKVDIVTNQSLNV